MMFSINNCSITGMRFTTRLQLKEHYKLTTMSVMSSPSLFVIRYLANQLCPGMLAAFRYAYLLSCMKPSLYTGDTPNMGLYQYLVQR
jgi:hypothetical protein